MAKSKKYSQKFVVVGRYRVFFFKKKVLGKGLQIDKNFSLLDLVHIEQQKDSDSVRAM
jgi:hypothetical protein